jgi:hypothetical protein
VVSVSRANHPSRPTDINGALKENPPRIARLGGLPAPYVRAVIRLIYRYFAAKRKCRAVGATRLRVSTVMTVAAACAVQSTHLPGNGAGDSRLAGGAAPRIGGEGEEVRHVPCVHTWPPLHVIRHPPQLPGSLEVATHFPNQIICPTGHCRPCAFAAN